MQKHVIDIQHLSFKIRKKIILEDVTLQIKKGDIYALVGNNGAGKTTLIKMILGLENYSQGKIFLFGSEEIQKQRFKIGTVMSCLTGNPSQKGKDYLREMCILSGVNPKEEIPYVAELTGCTSWLNKPLGSCSDGMYKRILIAGAMVGSPELLILDEPFNAIDPHGMEHMRVLLYTLHQKGVTILVTSHILPELLRLATRFGIICEGVIQCEDSVSALSEKNLFRYLYSIENISEALQFLEKEYPSLFVIPWYEKSIAVIAMEMPMLPQKFCFLGKEKPNIDEILRFYMSGKGKNT